MADNISLSVVTADGVAFEQKVSYVNIPTTFGSVGILTGHAPMLCAVSKGVLRCSYGDNIGVSVEISDGVANVAENEVTVLVSDAKLI